MAVEDGYSWNKIFWWIHSKLELGSNLEILRFKAEDRIQAICLSEYIFSGLCTGIPVNKPEKQILGRNLKPLSIELERGTWAFQTLIQDDHPGSLNFSLTLAI